MGKLQYRGRWAARIVLCCWAMSLSAVNAGEQVWRRVNRLPAPDVAARLQADLFVVSGEPDRLKSIETASADQWKGSVKEVRDRLAEYGSVHLAGHFDENVVVGTKATFTSSLHVPMQSPAGDGKVRHSIEDLGCSLELKGFWQDQAGRWVANMDISAESGVLSQSADVSRSRPANGSVSIPEVLRAKAADEIALENDTPGVLVGSVVRGKVIRADGTKDLSDAASLLVARLVLTREESTATRPAERIDRIQERGASEPLDFEFELFALEGSAKDLVRVDPSNLDVPANATAQQILDALNKWGQAELLSRPKVLAAPGESAKVSIGERLPVIRGTVGESGEAKPDIDYQDLGLKLDLKGTWIPEGSERVAHVVCGLENAFLSPSPSGKPPQISKLEQKYESQLRAGSWSWLPRQRQPGLTGEKTGYWLVRVRLNAAGKATESEATSPGAAASMQAQPKLPPRVRVDAWRLEASPTKLAETDLNALLQGDLTDSQIVERLGQLGKAQRVAGVTEVLDPKEGIVLKSGEELNPAEWRGKDAAGRADTKCTRVSISGGWLGELPGTAELSVGFANQDLIPPVSDTEQGGLWSVSEAREETTLRLAVGQSAWGKTCWANGAADPAADKAGFLLVRAKLLQAEGGHVCPEHTGPMPGNAAHLQMNLFRLECPLDVMWRTDFQRLASTNPSPELLLSALRRLGAAELVRIGDLRMAEPGSESASSLSERVPLVMDVGVNCRGEVNKPRPRYEVFGIRSELKGRWVAGQPHLLLLDFDMKDSGRESVNLSKELTLPVLTQLKHAERLCLAEGRPVLLVSKGMDPVADPARVKLDIVQVLAVKGSPGSESSLAAGDSLEAKDANQAAHVRVETFVTDVASGQLHSLLRLKPGDAESGPMLMQQLTRLGPTRLLAISEGQMVLTAANRVGRGERAPLVNNAGPVPLVNYEDEGYSFSISGGWREDAADVADLAWEWQHSEIIQKGPLPGKTPAPAGFTRYRTERHSVIQSGRPLIVQGTIATNPAQDGPGQVQLVTTRLMVTRIEK